MKKVLFLIVALMLFTIGLPNVNAYSKGDKVGQHYDSKTKYDGYNVTFYRHKLDEKNITCLQPGYGAKRNGADLYVRFKYTYNDSTNIKAYIAGISYLQSKIEDDYSDVAVTNAVRAFNMIWTRSGLSPSLNTGSSQRCEGDYCGHYRVAVYFYNRMVNNYQNTIKNATGKDLPGTLSGASSFGLSTKMKDKTVGYIKDALNKAKETREVAVKYKGSKVEIDNLITPVEQKEKNSSGKHYYYKEHIRKVTLKDVNPEDGAYLKFKCGKCSERGITTTIKVSKTKNGTYKTLTKNNAGEYNIVLKSLGTEDGKGSFYLKVTFSTDKSLEECKKTKSTSYSIESYIRANSDENKELYVLAHKSNGNYLTPSDGYQNFLYTKKSDSNDDKNDYVNSKIKVCDGDGDDIPSCRDTYDEYMQNPDNEELEKELIPTCCNPSATDSFDLKKENLELYNEKCGDTTNSCEYKYNEYLKDKTNELKIIDLKDNCCPYPPKQPIDNYLVDLYNGGDLDATLFVNNHCPGSTTTFECITKVDDVICNDEESIINLNEGIKVDKSSCSYENKKDVKNCVIQNKDFAKNNYLAETDGLESNPYCSFYCNEDYNITVPGIQKLDSGRKIYLEAKIKGTKSCYSGAINQTKFEYDLEKAQNDAKELYTNYMNSKTEENKNKLTAANNKIEKIINQFTSCTKEFDDNKKNSNSKFYNYDPKIKFSYDDEGFKDDIKQLKMHASDVKFDDYSIEYCYGTSVDSSYRCNTTTTQSTTDEIEVVKYTTSGEKTETYNISTATFVKHSQNVSAEYVFPDKYFVIPGSGAIAEEKKDNYTPLGNYVPVSLTAKTGSYKYYLEIDNLGEYYSGSKKGELGRIWGDEDSVVNKILSEKGSDTCNDEVNKFDNKSSIKTGKYVCYYKINCPDCPTECKPGECEIVCDGDCDTVCDNCIIVNGESNFSYRSITTENINPNKRTLGKNWNFTKDNIQTTTELKAYKTTTDIVANGEKIYSDDSNEMVLKVKLTPDMIRKIKEYNESTEVIDKGGFANSTLDCYPYEESGITYQNVFCYSSYLDTLIKNYPMSFEFKKERLEKNKRATTKNQNSYWTTWTDVLNNSEFTVNTNFEKYLDGAGPSYR